MRTLMIVGLTVLIVAVVSGSLGVADRRPGNPGAPSIDPFALTLKAGELPTLEVTDPV